MTIKITPTPRNKEGRDDMPWNIWRDGRNTNVKPNKAEAEAAAQRLRERYGETSPTADEPKGEPVVEKHYMDVPRPRGAPDIGRKVQVSYLDDKVMIGTVTAWLSIQFIIETEAGNDYPFLISEVEWTYLD